MKRFKRILVAIDTRHERHPIVAEAAEIAQANGATLKIVDVVPPFSWLARQTNHDHEHLSELVKQEKESKVADLAAQLGEKEIDVEIGVLVGEPSVEIIREVIRGDHDLLMAVSKGKHSSSDHYFGHTAIRLLRQCPCTVWLVSPDSSRKIQHVVGCVDTASDNPIDFELNDKIMEMSLSLSQFNKGTWSILHVWSVDDGAVFGDRIKPEKLLEYETEAERFHAENFDRFLERFDESLESGNAFLLKGPTANSIETFVNEQSVDLLVLGTVARSGLGGFFIGNTAEEILDNVHCSVLALKPYQFKSSIKLHD